MIVLEFDTLTAKSAANASNTYEIYAILELFWQCVRKFC